MFAFCLTYPQGICPGNRLKIVSYEPTTPTIAGHCLTPSPVSSPCPSTPNACCYSNQSMFASGDNIVYENAIGNGGCHATTIYHQQQQKLHGKRRSWHTMPNKVWNFFLLLNLFNIVFVVFPFLLNSTNKLSLVYLFFFYSAFTEVRYGYRVM